MKTHSIHRNNHEINISIIKTTKSFPIRRVMTILALMSLFLSSQPMPAAEKQGKAGTSEIKTTDSRKAEAKSDDVKAVNPEVQSEVDKNVEEKRARLLKDAESALDETNNAIKQLDQGKKEEALAALERVTGKLDLIIARDPNLSLAPVAAVTVVRDLYASPDSVAEAVKTAKNDLAEGRVQQARALLAGLASETEIQVSNLPLATYPSAIKAVAPLIDAGKLEEAKAALRTALNTLVVETYVTPLPNIRANAMLGGAEKLAEKASRTADENKKLHDLIEDARYQLKLGEVLGYGNKDSYKPLYSQLDEIEKKTEGGKSGKGWFENIKTALKSFSVGLTDGL